MTRSAERWAWNNVTRSRRRRERSMPKKKTYVVRVPLFAEVVAHATTVSDAELQGRSLITDLLANIAELRPFLKIGDVGEVMLAGDVEVEAEEPAEEEEEVPKKAKKVKKHEPEEEPEY